MGRITDNKSTIQQGCCEDWINIRKACEQCWPLVKCWDSGITTGRVLANTSVQAGLEESLHSRSPPGHWQNAPSSTMGHPILLRAQPYFPEYVPFVTVLTKGQ